VCYHPQQQLSDSHTVIQYHYTGWPEQGSPSTGAGMVDLIDQVVKRQQYSGNHPVVVHCRYVLRMLHLTNQLHIVPSLVVLVLAGLVLSVPSVLP